MHDTAPFSLRSRVPLSGKQGKVREFSSSWKSQGISEFSVKVREFLRKKKTAG